MKNRIIAVFLAFAVLVGVFSIPKRARAAAAAVTIVSIGVLAWEILDIMIKGEEPAIIVGIREVLESGVDALTNPDSYFQQTYGDFWNDFGGGYDAVYNKVLEMYEDGDIVIKNGAVELSYSQYKELFDITYNYLPNIGFEFTTSYNYFAFSYTPGTFLPVLSLPVNDMYFKNGGQTYGLFFYNDSKAVFSDIFFGFSPNNDRYDGIAMRLSNSFATSNTGWFFQNFSENELDHENWRFSYSSLSAFVGKWYIERTFSSSNCFVFENGHLSYQPISSVDVTDCSASIISTGSDYAAFLQSISSVASTDSVASVLDDLSSVLPVEKNPVFSIPISPDLSVPVPDQVTVSVPGANDIPLTDYMDPLITDIEAPSALATKFPFCIPFDFIRIISVLAADPIPPVFHIPISTHPANLEGFADNETIGEFVSPDDPMFDINEEIVIDFAHIPLVQAVSYSIFLIGFVIMLIKLTPKLIQH